MLHVLRRLVMTTAGPTSSLAARSNEKKKGRNLVFGSDGTRVLDRGELFLAIFEWLSTTCRHRRFFLISNFILQASGRSLSTVVSVT